MLLVIHTDQGLILLHEYQTENLSTTYMNMYLLIIIRVIHTYRSLNDYIYCTSDAYSKREHVSSIMIISTKII